MLFLILLSFVVPGAWAKDTWRNSKKLPDWHHAVGLRMGETDKRPPNWPLDDRGRLQCATCHGNKDMEDVPLDEADTKADNFLRGGPYRKLEDFCARCHEARDHRRPNIHVMLKDDGTIDKDHCSFCHEEVHEQRDQPRRLAEWLLRIPADKLCYGCHLKTPHLNALQHQVKPDAKIHNRLREAAKEHGVILPLSVDGKVMCVTCHSPHPPGVIDAVKNPAGRQTEGADIAQGENYLPHTWDQVFREDKRTRLDELNRRTGQNFELGYSRIQREALLRLPAKDGTLCQSCHVFER